MSFSVIYEKFSKFSNLRVKFLQTVELSERSTLHGTTQRNKPRTLSTSRNGVAATA